ncbi:MAG TPA: 8-oxoguanine DNA glycosylase [Candidatus Hungatella pullicola]|nr:8-oxoguanine DNA glycosylase [Candidatus Hungatella pullicola]
MYQIAIDHMDLEQIARSGQCFRMRRLEKEGGKDKSLEEGNRTDGGQMRGTEELWAVTAMDQYTEICQRGNEFTFSCGEKEFEEFWRGYFDFSRDYGHMKETIDPQDSYLKAAVKFGWGVRILSQDLWEMILTFLISQNNNIKRIAASVEALCHKYGPALTGQGFDGPVAYYGFPGPKDVYSGGLEGLQELGLGYRDKYIFAMAEWCSTEEGVQWLEDLSETDYHTAHSMLISRLGIGKKVADCICLFGLGHVEAFPVDTHIRQILDKWYPEGFPLKRYEGFAGIIQQYLFYYKRNGQAKGGL